MLAACEKHFNQLTAAEDERLALLLEECGEVIQAIGKIQRHGYESVNPLDPDSLTNRMLLTKELGDVRHAIERLLSAGDIDNARLRDAESAKAAKIGRWLHHQTVPLDAPAQERRCVASENDPDWATNHCVNCEKPWQDGKQPPLCLGKPAEAAPKRITQMASLPLLESLSAYCEAHPEQRFWQALRNWSGAQVIAADGVDTFYWADRKPAEAAPVEQPAMTEQEFQKERERRCAEADRKER